MCNVHMLQTFMELEVWLSSFTVDTLDLLMFKIRTCMAVGDGGRVTFYNHTNMVWGQIFWTEVVPIVFEWDLAVMDCAAQKPNVNTIYYNNPYLQPLPYTWRCLLQ